MRSPVRRTRGAHLSVERAALTTAGGAPDRQLRRILGKSDTVDAVEANRAVLSGRARGVAKTADGNVEAMRALLIAKRSGREARITCLNQLRHLG